MKLNPIDYHHEASLIHDNMIRRIKASNWLYENSWTNVVERFKVVEFHVEFSEPAWPIGVQEYIDALCKQADVKTVKTTYTHGFYDWSSKVYFLPVLSLYVAYNR